MNTVELQNLIKNWLEFQDPSLRLDILKQAQIPCKGKKITDNIRYYVRGKTVHNPLKKEIWDACRQLVAEEEMNLPEGK